MNGSLRTGTRHSGFGQTACWLVAACALWLSPVWAAAPDWLDDPVNSKWILFGGNDGVAETNGIVMRSLKSSEGNLRLAERKGVPCAQSVRSSGDTGFFYLEAEPWEQFRAWLGDDSDVLLTVRYFDGGKGKLLVRYDSSDPRVRKPPYPAGVWRAPNAHPKGVRLDGSKTWKTLRTTLELAFFTKRVHGADLRIDPACKDFALAGVALTRVPKGAGPDLLVKQELRVARAAGLVSFGKGARFAGRFEQRTDEPIVMEAELATELGLSSGRAPGAARGASGGAYVHYVESATWVFRVKTPGRYVMWERAYFPWGGHWNHEEHLDDEAGGRVSDHRGAVGKEWEWVKARTYDLTAGRHTFRLNYHGGARLDVLVLSRDGEPPDVASLRSSYRGQTSGEVWTTPVRPFDLAQWRSVQFMVPGGGDVECRLSLDAGKSWQVFDPSADLSDLAVAGGGKDTIAFHLTIEGGEYATLPLLAGASLLYQAGPQNVRAIENSRLRVEIDPYGIRSIFDKEAGVIVSQAAQLHDAVAMVAVKRPGPSPIATEDLYNSSFEHVDVTASKDAPVLTMSHLLACGVRLVTMAKLLPNGQSEWQLRIDNPTDLEVAEIRFPVVTGCRLGGGAEDDWIFMPKCWGQVWQHPAKDGRLQARWGPSMRWTALWDDRQGLYLGIEDARLDDYGFVYGGDSSGGLTLAACQRILVKPRSKWTSGVYRLALTGGDWHEGADIYRAYAARTLKPCDVPPYVKWFVDRWTTQPSNDTPTQGWDVIRPTPEHLMAANRQMTDGADSGYCGLYPYPAQAWGSTEELSQKLAVRRALGGMYTPYHNFHLWSPGYGHYPRIGSFPKSRIPKGVPVPDDEWYRKATSYSYDGSYSRAETDYFAQRGMAMGSREWRDWLAYWTERYLDWGADGMYYDQFNMIYSNGKLYPDFDTYGCWTRATLKVFSKMKEASRARNPFYTSSGEVCNDVYGQFVDLHMTSGVFNRLEFYRYCNPGQLLIDGGWNGGLGKAFGGQERTRFIWQVGARFEGHGDPAQLQLRRAVKSIVYDAQFMDTVGVTIRDAKGKELHPEHTHAGGCQNAPFRGVIGRWFSFRKGKQRGAVVNLINCPVQKGATLTLNTQDIGPVRAAMAWTYEGKSFVVNGSQTAQAYAFPVPAAELSSVVLSGGMRPLVEWQLDHAAAPGVSRKFRLKLTNVNADSIEGSARLRLPSGWPSPTPATFGPLAGGRSIAFAMRVPVPSDAKIGRHHVWCDITTAQGDFSAYSFLAVNEPVLADLRGGPGSYHVWLRNLTAKPLMGKLSCIAPPSLTINCPNAFALPPEATIELSVTVTGQDRIGEITEVRAEALIGSQHIRLVRAVIPAVPNGDFETDSAGDRKPDWWMCRKLGDRWSYERMHLAEGAHSGKYCLRLDPPQDGEKFICAYPVHSVLKPNTRYRVSIWIKAASEKGVYANICGKRLGWGATSNEWQQFSAEVTTGDRLTGLYRTLYNHSAHPAYFDDLVVREIRP